jgi:hypothetical protein
LTTRDVIKIKKFLPKNLGKRLRANFGPQTRILEPNHFAKKNLGKILANAVFERLRAKYLFSISESWRFQIFCSRTTESLQIPPFPSPEPLTRFSPDFSRFWAV